MAFSQKHDGKILVPWFNKHEWNYVYDLICIKDNTKKNLAEALRIIKIWKARTPLLFCGVEGTMIIIEAMLQNESAVSEDNLCLLYCTAVMRFLNICGAKSDQQGNFHKAARKNNIPQWLIAIRHDFAHDQKVPSKYATNLALKFSLKWLKENYWEIEKDNLTDFISDNSNLIRNNINNLCRLYCNMTLTAIRKKCKQLSDYGEDATEFSKLIKNHAAYKNIAQIQDTILSKISDDNNNDDFSKLPEILFDSNCLFEYRFGTEQTISKSFLNMWEKLLQFMYMKNVLPILIKKLFYVSCGQYVDDNTRELSSIWLVEIFKAIWKQKVIYDKVMQIKIDNNGETLDYRTAFITLSSIVEKENPDLKGTLNFQTFELGHMEELKVIRNEIVDNPHEYTLLYLKLILQICGFKPEMIADYEKAVKLYTIAESNVHPYTEFVGIEQLIEKGCIKAKSNQKQLNIDVRMELVDDPDNPWKLVREPSIFAQRPFGVLPSQNSEINATITFKTM